MKTARVLPVVVLGFVLVCEVGRVVAEPSQEEIDRWVKQLDADEFWVREDASKRLFQAGLPAVKSLTEAARSEKLEMSTRAIGVLARLLDTNDPQLEAAAENALEEIAGNRVTTASARAESALDGYRGTRQERALAKLKQLGAQVHPTAYLTGAVHIGAIEIGEGWRGANEDLAILKRIPTLSAVHIYVPSVDDRAVKHLAALPQLTELRIFGTGITDDGVEQLKKELANTKIDRRNGAMLGVGGQPNAVGGGCLVTVVQADSAAEKAGVQPGDVITKFDGKQIEDFDSLTKLIATKSGGEAVDIEVRRGGETIKRNVKLGHWKNAFRAGDYPQIIGPNIIIQDR